MPDISENTTISLIKNALFNLYNDEKHPSERSLVFRFGIHLQNIMSNSREFDGYNLDCEYTRNNIDEPKRNPENMNKTMVPDMIIHKRHCNDNLIVIEFKGWWEYNKNEIRKDINKLKFLTSNDNYNYTYGFFIKFGKVPQETTIKLYKSNCHAQAITVQYG